MGGNLWERLREMWREGGEGLKAASGDWEVHMGCYE